ncbi:fibrillin-2-like [Mytilus californianus]|uniref:fibrillin-2-like n=1 Tax=Mytilus californianus TaxID=6549 RepID=UPI00224570AA|nr:fibrillin-2-like [Mytilus californianus]
MSKIKYTDGVTYTAGALNVTKNVLFTAAKGDRDAVPNFVILVTDGNSNYRKDLTIEYADNLKSVAVIYALGIGRELEEFPEELLAIVRQPEIGNPEDMVQMLKDYNALEELKLAIFDNMCPSSPCYEEGKVFEKRCRTFKCINSKWKKMGFTGCISNGRCYEWGEERSDACYQYKCFKPANCKSNLCPSYDYRLFNAGCLVDGQCVDENKVVEDKSVCANFQCIRRTFDNNEVYSEYLMVGKECVRSDGTCSEVGYTYEEHCIKYECQASTFNGILTAEFMPINTACKYGNKCVQLGERITEVCDVLVCNYDDKAMGYELMLESQGCEHNGKCLMKNEKVFEESTCTNFVCTYSRKQNRLVMKERVAGCKGTDGSCAAKGEVVTQRGCIKYQCDKKGNLELIEAGCDVDGECKPVGSKWRQPGECAVFRCVLVDTVDDSVETDIEQDLECHNFDGECVKPGEKFDDHCITYRCKNNGKLDRVTANCEFKGKCYDSGETWVEMSECLTLSCYKDDYTGESELSSSPYGCLEEGICKNPGDKYEKDCQTYECQPNGQGFQIVDSKCPWKNGCKNLNQTWFDKKTCRRYGCFEDEDGLDIEEITYGCRGMNDECINDRKDLDQDKCISYDCNNGQLVPQKIGCLDHDQCFFPGAKKVEDCSTYVCSRDGTFKIVDPRCPKGKTCRPLDSSWVNKDLCVKETCGYEEGNMFPDILPSPYGCPYNDKCKPDGAIWRDRKTCTTYKCKRENISPTRVIMHTVERPGCKGIDGKCVKEGDTRRYECTDYVCDTSRGGLVITGQGCQDESGECFSKGQRKKRSCNKFVCNAKGNFQVVKAGCEKNGKCYDIDESWQEGCVWFTCALLDKGPNFVETEITERHGCVGADGKCYEPGETFTDGCISFKCKPGGDFEEENFGCVGFDGGCVLPGETIDNDCNNDKHILGCQTANKCVRPGARVKGKDCVKFQCKNGKMVPTDIGCEFDGECLPLHMSVQEGCSWRKCVIAAEGPNYIDTRLITEHGCMTPDGYCIDFNEVYEYTKGTEKQTYVCGEIGDLEPVVIEYYTSDDHPLDNCNSNISDADHKCKMSAYGKEYDVGAEVVFECKTYKCVKTIDAATFVQVKEDVTFSSQTPRVFFL